MKNLNTYLAVAFLALATASFAQVQKIQTVQITGGNPGEGKVLTSDANGVASWQNASNSGGTGALSGSTVAVTAVSPIHSSTGKVWMDRNLGASRKAQSVDDYLAYGQLYQWGRGNDGHADINWTSATSGTPVNGTTTTQSTTDYPNNNLFIASNAINFSNWRATQNDNLWQGVAGVNNPCPAGYRLPTSAELTAEVTAYSITNPATAFESPLKFTAPGVRQLVSAEIESVGYGFYWSSSVNGAGAIYRLFHTNGPNGGTMSFNDNRSNGCSIRCIKD